MNILFIGSLNKRRSLTAEAIYKGMQAQDIVAKSAGTEPSATTKITAKLLLWADVIFVMEKDHIQRMADRFPLEVMEKEIVILNIPDEYEFMDPELVESIKTQVDACLAEMNR
jgi:predicted protein tyrosine phosphatase